MTKIEQLASKAAKYLHETYIRPEPIVKTERIIDETKKSYSSDIRYSLVIEPDINPVKEETEAEIILNRITDKYDSMAIQVALFRMNIDPTSSNVVKILENNTDASFVDKMLMYISAKKMKDSEVYKAAQIDRRLFSKMVADSKYKPSKDTCIAICYALHLSLDQATDMLQRAGYALSHSSNRDVVLEFFFREQEYDITEINEVLYKLSIKLLGRP